MPDFDVLQIANLIDLAQVHSKLKKPEWKSELQKRFGFCGIKKEGYTDLTKVFLWEWNVNKLGRLYLDAECKLFYDGENFMVRTSGHPDDEKFSSVSVSLTNYLTDRIRERDVKILNDVKWKNKHLWHEFIRMTMVSLC